MRKLTHEEFVKRVYEMYGDEYTVLSKYKNAISPITMRHNNCTCEKGYFVYETTPHSIKSGKKCPYESHQYGYTIENFKKTLKDKFPNYICMDSDYKNASTDINVKCDKGHVFHVSLNRLQKNNYKGCPYCSGRYIYKGFNDLCTTNPEIAKHLKNKEDGHNITIGNIRKKVCFICPNCNNEIFTYPSTLFDKNGKVICKFCGDGFSYPEKVLLNVLFQLDISFITQLSSHNFKWCDKYRYDVFINDYNMIIEINGMQHYKYVKFYGKSFDQQRQTDLYKKKLALENGIDRYIVIDARFSDFEYIKNNILESELSDFFNFDNIDWDICKKNAMSSLMIKSVDLYNEGFAPEDIAEKLHLYKYTIYDYLDKGKSSGLCDFDRKKHIEQNKKNSSLNLKRNYKEVICKELNYTCNSYSEANRMFNAYITKDIVDNPNRTSGGYHWLSVS